MSETSTYTCSTSGRCEAVAIPLVRQAKANFSIPQTLIENGTVDAIIVVAVLLLIGLLGG